MLHFKKVLAPMHSLTTGGWGGRRIARRDAQRRMSVKPVARTSGLCYPGGPTHPAWWDLQEIQASGAAAAMVEEALPCSLVTPRTPPSCLPPCCFNQANQFDYS